MSNIALTPPKVENPVTYSQMTSIFVPENGKNDTKIYIRENFGKALSTDSVFLFL